MKLANQKLDAFDVKLWFMGLRRLRNIVLFLFAVVLFCGCTTHKTGDILNGSFKVTPTFIRLMDKNYFWALKDHYMQGTGLDVFLTKDQFDNLMRHGKIDFSTVKLIDDDYVISGNESISLKYGFPDVMRLFDRFKISTKMIAI